MDDERPLFQGMDELERTYAPQQLPADDPEQARVRVDEEGSREDEDEGRSTLLEPPSAAPVASVGTTPSSSAAPPNIGHANHGGAPGDPQTEAGYPIGRDEPDKTR